MLELKKRTKGTVSYWAIPKWEEQGIVHGFVDSSLDFKPDSNESGFRSAFGDLELKLLEQIHSDFFVDFIKTKDKPSLKADAWLANWRTECCSNIAFGIKTADCVPVLINDYSSGYISALHCGWRGAAKGLLPKVLKEMEQRGVELSQTEVAFGPAASVKNYEVKGDVVSEIVQKSRESISLSEEKAREALFSQVEDRICANIPLLLCKQARALGVSSNRILVSGVCTIDSPDFFSYRRQGDKAGRQLSFIGATLPR